MDDAEPKQPGDEELDATRGGLGDLLGDLTGGSAGSSSGSPAAGPDLGGIQGLLGGGPGLPGIPQDAQEPANAELSHASTVGGMDLGGLLGGLLGGQQGGDVAGQGGSMGPAIMQAVLPLLMGALFKGQDGGRTMGARAGLIADPAQAAATDDMAALLEQTRTSGVPDEETLRKSAATRHVANLAGIDIAAATQALQQLLKALQGQPAKPKTKPKPSSASHKPKPKPASASHKPKPSASTSARPKPKPTPAVKPHGSTKPKQTGKHSTGGNKRSTGGG